MVVDSEGNRRWYNDKNQLHREDGPAVEYTTGDKTWFQNGKFHRIDGPAIEYSDSYPIWFINGQYYEKSELDIFGRRIQLVIWRVGHYRRIMKTIKSRWLDELLVLPPRGLFPGGAMYQESITHFEGSQKF